MRLAGLLLAGGASSRFGAEKAVAAYRGGVLMDAALEALSAACAEVAISAREGSGAAHVAESRGHPRLADAPGAPAGPLAGVFAGLAWATEIGASHLATAPCDAPGLEAVQVAALAQAAVAADGKAAAARSGRGLEPLIAVWPVARSRAVIAEAFARGEHPPVRQVLREIGWVAVDGFDGVNVNAPADIDAPAPAAAPSHARLFAFEDDFVRTLRCIPMCVRLKLDRTGVKLSLRQWSRFSREDREALRLRPCAAPAEVDAYRDALLRLIATRGGEAPAMLPASPEPVWGAPETPEEVARFASARGAPTPAAEAWAALEELERYALVKLSRDKHENANFVPALKEFGLIA